MALFPCISSTSHCFESFSKRLVHTIQSALGGKGTLSLRNVRLRIGWVPPRFGELLADRGLGM